MYKIHQSKSFAVRDREASHCHIILFQTSTIHITTHWPQKNNNKKWTKLFGKSHFQSFFSPEEQSDFLPNITEDMKIYKLSAGDGQYTDPVMACSKALLPLGFLYQTSHKYIKLEIDKTGTKQQGVRLASPSGKRLYKLKVGQSQTTPLLLHNLLNSDGITLCTHKIRTNKLCRHLCHLSKYQSPQCIQYLFFC